jgi:hypothetical protein
LKILKVSWRLFLVSVLAFSLALNIALFVGGAFYKLASSAVSAVTGMRTLALQHADEVASLSGDLAEERVAKQKLRGELSDMTSELATERVAARQLRDELADPFSRRVLYKGEKVAVRDVVNATASRISKRAMVTSSREVGSMAGEALPYIGVAVIVGVTALELKDLCDTLKDMSELQRAVSPETSPSEEEKTICAIKVPTRQELWEKVKASPGKAWESAIDSVPTLEEIRNIEIPEIDLQNAWLGAVNGTGRVWEATKDGTGKAWEGTKAGVGKAGQKTKDAVKIGWDALFGSKSGEVVE